MNKKYIKIEDKFHIYQVFHKNNKTKKNKTCHYKVFYIYLIIVITVVVLIKFLKMSFGDNIRK